MSRLTVPPDEPPAVVSRAQRAIRLIGAIVLTVCAAMVVLGISIWQDDLQGPQFALYWSWCFLFAIAAIVVAIVDLVLLRRTFRRSRKELFRKQFMSSEFVREAKSARKKRDPSAGEER